MAKIKVMLDPGHGGNDPGALSRDKTKKEKDIALNTCKIAKSELEATGLFEVRLTKDGDQYKTLEERAKLANNWGADIFVSVHANSSDNIKANGIETYCLDTKYRKLADHINNGILEYFEMNNRGVKTANFSVLRNTKMSACLTELAFISNDSDLQILLNHQREFAFGIVRGILLYYNYNTFPGQSQPENEKTFIVATGAYKDIDNAKREMHRLRDLGIETYIHSC